jgi:hypothetical protein
VHRESLKMVKLVEAEEHDRPVPVVSFIARQRDLADMVGEDMLGDEHIRLRASLRLWEGRYETIKLAASTSRPERYSSNRQLARYRLVGFAVSSRSFGR